MFRAGSLLLFILTGLTCLAQSGEQSTFGGLVYKSTGLGLAFQKRLDMHETYGKQFEVELATFHHPRETKTFNADINNPSPYVFGKLNRAAILKVNYAVSRKVSQFNEQQRIGLDLTLGGGMMLGFLKPVYLNIIYPDPIGFEAIVSERYDPDRHTDKSQIAGYADGRIGWSQLTYKAGISVSAGLGFTWGYFANFPKRLETGLYGEYFKNGLPVMAFTRNKPLQGGVYIRLFLGKKVSKN